MAHKKAGGSTRLGRDSNPQYLGTKVGDGQMVRAGAVIVRQRGTKIFPGKNVKKGKDDTLFATLDGKIKFTTRKRRRFDGALKTTKFANVISGNFKKVMKKYTAKKTAEAKPIAKPITKKTPTSKSNSTASGQTKTK